MAISRANRAIEAFDISLMAVVTKAMGAFLVLMLVLYQDQAEAPKVEQRAEEAQAERVRNDQAVAVLNSEHQRLSDLGTAHAANLERLRQRVAELERQQGQSGGGQPQQGGYPALILTLSQNCGPGTDFYVRGENVPLSNGSAWPDVERGPQALPRNVVQDASSESFLRTLIDYGAPASTVDPSLTNFEQGLAGSAGLRIFDAIQPGWKFAIYAKIPPKITSVLGFCNLFSYAFLAATTNKPEGSVAEMYETATKGGQIVLMGHLVWENDVLNYIQPTAAEQTELDKRFGVQ